MNTTPVTLVVLESKTGLMVHRSTCKRANFSLPGHSFGAIPADYSEARAAGCCKPKLPAAPDAEPTEVPTGEVAAPVFSEDPAELVRLAKDEKKALDIWKATPSDQRPGWPPLTPNLDELNRQYAAGVTAKDRKAKKAKTDGTSRTKHTDPRAIEAFARKKAGPRGKGKPITDDELETYVAGIYPGAGRYAEQEICYWVEGYSVGKARWVAAWTKVEEARLAEAS